MDVAVLVQPRGVREIFGSVLEPLRLLFAAWAFGFVRRGRIDLVLLVDALGQVVDHFWGQTL
jgi:hypothetical protein